MTGIRRNSLSLIMYFKSFNPLDIGRSTSERMISISGPSAFSASITCLGDLTEVTEIKGHLAKLKHVINHFQCLKKYNGSQQIQCINDVEMPSQHFVHMLHKKPDSI